MQGLVICTTALHYHYYCNRAVLIAALISFCFQILTPVVKPDKKESARLYWNLVHWGLGYATAALAVANVFLGFDILVRRAVVHGVQSVLQSDHKHMWDSVPSCSLACRTALHSTVKNSTVHAALYCASK